MFDQTQVPADTADALKTLRLLAERPELSQRQLSEELGLSLGKTHYVLHALIDKGWVKIGNFRRHKHKLAYGYLLTPKGLRERLHLTRAFLMRKEQEFELLQATIAQLRREIDETGERAAEVPTAGAARTTR